MSYKGRYTPTKPKKYKGDPRNIVYRSLWECKFMVYYDTSDAIIEWGSEEIIIPYLSPKDGRMHRYFPDFYIRVNKLMDRLRRWLLRSNPRSSAAHQKNLKDVPDVG